MKILLILLLAVIGGVLVIREMCHDGMNEDYRRTAEYFRKQWPIIRNK